MNTCRILILSVLATGCAATADPAGPVQGNRYSFERVDAPTIEFEAAEAPASFDDSTFRLPPPPPDATLPALAQDAAAPPTEPESPHSFSGGVGVRIRGGDSALNVVAEYHYRVSPALDVGGIADWAGSPIDSLFIAPAAWLHPDDHLTLFGAPGVEFISGRGGNWALRLGGSYLIPFGRLAIRPFGWYDFVEDRKDSFSLGVAIGV